MHESPVRYSWVIFSEIIPCEFHAPGNNEEKNDSVHLHRVGQIYFAMGHRCGRLTGLKPGVIKLVPQGTRGHRVWAL